MPDPRKGRSETSRELEMKQVALHVCGVCGAAVPFDKTEGHGQAVELHYDWHRKLDEQQKQHA